jgi:hypothetical protein
MEIQLREIKLPRSLRLAYPRHPENLKDTWTKHTLFLVAAVEGKLAGYLILDRRMNSVATVMIWGPYTVPPRESLRHW